MKRVVDVEIMGQKFSVKSDADENYIRTVADYVDEKLRELLKSARPTAQFNVAIMAALNIADEYHQLKEKHETVLNRLNHLTRRLSITLAEEG